MKASVRWLRSLVPALDVPNEHFATCFQRAGFHVASALDTGAGLDSIVVGTVHAIFEDRTVSVASGSGTVHVACAGAPHLTVGSRVALARDGTLRSQASLGIGPLADVAILDADAEPGSCLADTIPSAQDTILELRTPDTRSDVLGHVGLARELAVMARVPFDIPPVDAVTRVARGTFDQAVVINVRDAHGCPHFGAVLLDDVHVSSAPWWVRARLHALGIPSVCNVIDIANLVMLELGRPLQAYDLDRIDGARVEVRRARAGESMSSIEAHALDERDLVICDAKGPIALAGILDDERATIAARTKRVLLTCGTFEPTGIERTARRLGLRTEASLRFARGVDPTNAPEVLAQAGALLTRLAGAAAVPGSFHALQQRWEPRQVRVHDRAPADEQVAGAHEILSRLGFEVIPLHGQRDSLLVSIPGFRPDLRTEQDVLDEVARIRRGWLAGAVMK